MTRKQLALAAALFIVPTTLLAQGSDLKHCFTSEIGSGRYRSADPSAGYRLLEACGPLWALQRQRYEREYGIDAEGADSLMAGVLHDSLVDAGM